MFLKKKKLKKMIAKNQSTRKKRKPLLSTDKNLSTIVYHLHKVKYNQSIKVIYKNNHQKVLNQLTLIEM